MYALDPVEVVDDTHSTHKHDRVNHPPLHLLRYATEQSRLGPYDQVPSVLGYPKCR